VSNLRIFNEIIRFCLYSANLAIKLPLGTVSFDSLNSLDFFEHILK